MRVISGKYKGKNIMGFNILGTRPTMDRVKESLFGMIQNNVKNSVCLDLFAGSGSLGIEALSNGASMCYFNEKNDEIFKILKNNLSSIEGCNLNKLDYMDALKLFDSKKIKFDLIFLDPPYKLNLINCVLDYICNNDMLNDDGLVICEFEFEEVYCDKLDLIKSKKYGTKMINIYKKI